MKRTLTISAWIFFAATIYLIAASAVHPWIELPTLGDIGFTLVFVLFALLHCAAFEGARRTAVFFAVSAIVSFLMEETGVRTGLVFGAYHYSDMLGAKLGHVPVIVPLAWFMMIYPSWMVGRALLRGVDTNTLPGLTALAAIAAFVMTAWDVVMDPGMAGSGNWIWENGGAYFGVPRRNYLGWLATTFLVYWIAGWFWRGADHRRGASKTFAALPVLVYAAYALHYLSPGGIPALQVVALFAMVAPALLAVIHLTMNRGILKPVPPSVASRRT